MSNNINMEFTLAPDFYEAIIRKLRENTGIAVHRGYVRPRQGDGMSWSDFYVPNYSHTNLNQGRML